ncbi:PREDICTED: leucine-rich repeat receptor-like serine/threonine-protein kinase BAM1 [Camelina sativa]|uniref:Leucine-rich repeat receptor-like serine/threonine-protein kinase BAM1 n=1 Tax=Camelina sativa TaxID=90675 RepID=A0ABM0YEX4_CAMSA|nr:PREDICTED: leucine-rich repeat receptor-like serine/threonine-protein kinase BAM1 [Camelina sativa]
MNTRSFTLSIFAAVLFLQCLNPTGAATCHPDDEAGLLAFKSGITRDRLGILRQWKKGTKCCYWMGVICNTGDRVTKLEINGFGILGQSVISGTISPSLAKLQHLEGVYFNYLINVTGSFPQFLFKLPNLKYVDFTNTRLSGPLPANIGALRQLIELTLEKSQFTGPIPTSISNLTSLTLLRLSGNRISGTIPDVFKSMTKLVSLDLSRNRLSGNLPPSLALLSSTLELLDVSQNILSGTIPSFLSRLKVLSQLVLSKNQYSGVVPKSFANMKKLNHIDLSHNLLSGPFPTMKIVKGIFYLDLSNNHFHLTTIPEWVTSSQSIYGLKLVKCGIKMRLDDWKPSRPQFYFYIDLSENEITGSPTWFLNQAIDLADFQASGNKLQFDMGKLKFGESLRMLDISRNLVFGKVPATVVGLQTFNVSQNHLCGNLPVTKFPASAFKGNDCLCGSPLSPCKA